MTVLPAVALCLSEQTRRPRARRARSGSQGNPRCTRAFPCAPVVQLELADALLTEKSDVDAARWPLSSGRVGWLSARRADRDVTRVRNGLLRVSNDVVDVVQDATDGAVFGLTGMRDRLALAGGTLISAPQGGEWEVVAEGPE